MPSAMSLSSWDIPGPTSALDIEDANFLAVPRRHLACLTLEIASEVTQPRTRSVCSTSTALSNMLERVPHTIQPSIMESTVLEQSLEMTYVPLHY